ncbi:hypothetical protein ACHAW5_007938 [Stephanodiscus triporus]|uniref:Uncharacterized protein n=1 Tax=Stephanodiscus triporus TaxID=2934178 RepID=A0ABD3Q367_9STRA
MIIVEQSHAVAIIPSDCDAEASDKTPEINRRRWRFMFNTCNAPLVGAALFVYMFLSKAILRGTIIAEADVGTSYVIPQGYLRANNETQGLATSTPTRRLTDSPETSGEISIYPEDANTFSSRFWRSLDLSGDIKCGKYKCLFRQMIDHNGRGNVAGDDNIAFLVGSNCRRYQFETEMELSWKMAQYLQSTHQIKHLFLEAPRRVMRLPPAVDEIFNTKRLFKKSRRLCKTDASYIKWNFTIVQKVRLVSAPMFTIKKNTWTQFEDFVDEEIADKQLFFNTFAEDIGPALSTIETVPLLVHDFQILVDGKGDIFHFDLDRSFHAGLGGQLNDGRSYSSPGDFHKTFAQDFDESIEILNFLAVLSANQTQKKKIRSGLNERQSGESLLMGNIRKFSTLLCKAVGIVREMTGRDEVTRDAALMMVHLVETALLFDRLQHDDMPDESEDQMRNCSL